MFLSFIIPSLFGVASIKKATLIRNTDSAGLWNLTSNEYITREEYMQELKERRKYIDQMLRIESNGSAKNNPEQK